MAKVNSGTVTGYGEYENTVVMEGKFTQSGGSILYNQTINDALLEYSLIEDYYEIAAYSFLYLNGTEVYSSVHPNKTLTGPGTTGNVLKLQVNGSQNSSYKYRLILKLKGNFDIDRGIINYQGKPRSTIVKNLGDYEGTTLFGVHSDRTRIIDYEGNCISSKFDFCKSKGTLHTSDKVTSYTAIGYGWLSFCQGANRSISINGNICVPSGGGQAGGTIFFKPGDILETGTFSSGYTGVYLIYDYY